MNNNNDEIRQAPLDEEQQGKALETHYEQPNKKHVRFVKEIRIILIPHRVDYMSTDLHKLLWYSKQELYLIKRSAVMELRTYMNLFNLDVKPAMINLYQSMSKTDSLLLIKNARSQSKLKVRSTAKRRAEMKVMRYQSVGSSSKLMEFYKINGSKCNLYQNL